MIILGALLLTAGCIIASVNGKGSQEALIGNEEQARYKKACPDYRHYAVIAQCVFRHHPRFTLLMLSLSQSTIQ